MSAFLTIDEVRELTGYKLAGRQIRWLIDRRIPHYVNAAGRPIVLRSTLEGKRDRTDPDARINWSAVT